ncbi:MAG: FapA family protein [bacterium]
MAAISPRDGEISIEVSRDHFTAYIHVRHPAPGGREATVEDVMNSLAAGGITHGIKNVEKIQMFLDNLELYDNTLVVASGKPFTHGDDAKIIFHFECDSRSVHDVDTGGMENVDFRQMGTVTSVETGDVIATKIPATQGEEGITVHGQKLPGEWGMDIALVAGKNVRLAPNKRDYVAQIGGAPFVSNGVLRVDPVVLVDENVDYSTGNINFAGTVVVRGSVMDGFEVRALGDVVVENTVQMARVHAGGDVIVKRGILTRAKGVVSAEGNVYAKFIENSIVEAEGNVVVENAILNSRVYSNGGVLALTEEGTIIGGEVLAFERVAARTIGSAANSRTFIQTGYRHDVQKRYLETFSRLRAIGDELEEVKKDYARFSMMVNADLDKVGAIRTKAQKLLKVKKEIQDDLAEIASTRVFNHLAMVEAKESIFPGTTVMIGEGRYNVLKERPFASFKWDSDAKTLYLSSYDESAKGLKKAVPRSSTVLIIDDSRSVRKTLKLILEKMGLKVTGEAEDGEEGVEKYRELKPALVTCDVAMVRMDGIETLKAIKAENRRAKILMISSVRDRKKVLDCVMAGALDYILKPFVPKKVTAAVRNALES